MNAILNFLKGMIDSWGIFGWAFDIGLVFAAFESVIYIVFKLPKDIKEGVMGREAYIGDKYEKRVKKKLENAFNTDILRGLLLPNEHVEGGKTEADLVFVNTKGVFCIECKCREAGKYVMSFFDEGISIINLRNPFKQNKAHITAINNILSNSEVPVYNVFCMNSPVTVLYLMDKYSTEERNGSYYIPREKAFFIHIPTANDRVPIYNGIKTFKKLCKGLPDVYSKEDVKKVFTELKKYQATKLEHYEFEEAQKARYGNN